MVMHYNQHETYLCKPYLKPNRNKMINCIGDVDCPQCKKKLYLIMTKKYKQNNSNGIQLNLRMW